MTTCRYHGARKPDAIRKGANHPQYRHGQETLEAKAERSKVLAELREIEALSFVYGLVPAGTPRWRGKKPKGSGWSVKFAKRGSSSTSQFTIGKGARSGNLSVGGERGNYYVNW